MCMPTPSAAPVGGNLQSRMAGALQDQAGRHRRSDHVSGVSLRIPAHDRDDSVAAGDAGSGFDLGCPVADTLDVYCAAYREILRIGSTGSQKTGQRNHAPHLSSPIRVLHEGEEVRPNGENMVNELGTLLPHVMVMEGAGRAVDSPKPLP